MKLSDFKKELKQTGVSFRLVKRRFNKEFAEYPDLKTLIENNTSLQNVVCDLCSWENTEEGSDFWDNVSDGKNVLEQFKITAKSLGYEVIG